MDRYFLGIDLGTSGLRVVVIDGNRTNIAQAEARLTGDDTRDPNKWWEAACEVMCDALTKVDRTCLVAMAASATSGTVIGLDANKRPTGDVFLYSDPCPDPQILAQIRDVASDWTPARGASGGLGCALELRARGAAYVAHQGDWLNLHLTGALLADSSSALKSGFDPVACAWPDWVTKLGFTPEMRAKTVASGQVLARIAPELAAHLDVPESVQIIAGTTDGCASFLATGAQVAGDAVTVLGTTLTLKILSDKPIFDAKAGVYSHLIAGRWLAGGASNCGGGSLLQHFSLEQVQDLSRAVDGTKPSGLNYYPLPKIGERFPIADPNLAPRIEPRPKADAAFLHGLLDGLGAVEWMGYDKLTALGAPSPKRIFATGGGVKNVAWMDVRARVLDAELAQAQSVEAAYGTALLAMEGADAAPH